MLYEYNGKIYVRPFSNKIVEIELKKDDDGYDVIPTEKIVMLTPEIKSKMVQVTNEEAYNMINGKKNKSSLSEI